MPDDKHRLSPSRMRIVSTASFVVQLRQMLRTDFVKKNKEFTLSFRFSKLRFWNRGHEVTEERATMLQDSVDSFRSDSDGPEAEFVGPNRCF
jgi:hypothetical protein